MTARPRALLIVPLLIALAACGPTIPLNSGLRVDYYSVKQPSPTPSPLPPALNAAIYPTFPSIETPPPPPVVQAVATPTPSPAPPCPGTAPPQAVPDLEAVTTPHRAPAAGTYDFGYRGTYTLAGAGTSLPATGTREVKPPSSSVTDASGSYTFEVVERYDGITTSNVFLVQLNDPGSSALPNQPVAAGMYLRQMTSTDAAGRVSSFQPTPPVLLIPFPAVPGSHFTGSGTDALHARAMQIDPQPEGGTIVDHVRVNACGQVLDSWQVHVTGSFVNSQRSCAAAGPGCPPAADSRFDWTFNVGTQYGGLILAEHIVETGTDEITQKPFTYDITDNIHTKPVAAG